MNDATKRAMAPAVQAFFNSQGESLKAAHTAIEEAKASGLDVGELEQHLASFHGHATSKQTEVASVMALDDGTDTVEPFDGGPKP